MSNFACYLDIEFDLDLDFDILVQEEQTHGSMIGQDSRW